MQTLKSRPLNASCAQNDKPSNMPSTTVPCHHVTGKKTYNESHNDILASLYSFTSAYQYTGLQQFRNRAKSSHEERKVLQLQMTMKCIQNNHTTYGAAGNAAVMSSLTDIQTRALHVTV